MNARRQILFSIPVILLCVCGIRVGAGLAKRVREATPPVRFREHLVDHLPGAYQCAVADMNGDGKPDIVALQRQERDRLV